MEGLYIYDALGRMASRQAVTAVNNVPQVTTVFSQPVFDNTKVHALASATTTAELFPSNDQTVTYTGFDKAAKVKQGDDSVCFAYGHDRRRILMEEHAGGLTRTKQYWGACEYVTESDGGTTNSCWRTFVTGPYGVFAVVESRNGVDETHYVLKDHLGSWTTITDAKGTVEQRLCYDAWGNLRNPNTWANRTANGTFDAPMFDRGFTGHEHLTAFGLINMNGRMYDPVMSSFLSTDRFVQNPMTAMGFNRYAYCLNNPLKYTDPTGWLAGGGGGSGGSLPHVIIGGQTNYILPEVTIKPDDNPSLSNTPSFWEFYYTPHPGGGNPPFVNAGNEPSLKPSSGGGGSGSHGMGNSSVNHQLSFDLSLILSSESVVLGYKQQIWKTPKNRAQKELIQKKAYDIQKSLKSQGITKHIKDIKAGKISKLRSANRGFAALGIGLEVYDVINNKEIRASNIVNTGVTIVSIWYWPVGGVYLVTDLGSLLFTGQPIGDHIDDWAGEPIYDFNKP